MRVLLLATPQLQVLDTLAGEEVVTAVTPVVVVGVVGMVGAEYHQLSSKDKETLCPFLAINFFPLCKEARGGDMVICNKSDGER